MLPTANQISAAIGCAASTAKRFEGPLRDTCARFEIDTPKRLAAFLAQIGHESGSLGRTVENLNYSAMALLRTWPNRFDTASAARYARHPEAIANHVYGGRMGNGPEESGDGWRYRGRGLVQVTGKANYEAMAELLKSYSAPDFVAYPEQLEAPLWAAMSAGAFWDDHELNALADAGQLLSISRRINLGTSNTQATPNGWIDRKARYDRATRVLS